METNIVQILIEGFLKEQDKVITGKDIGRWGTKFWSVEYYPSGVVKKLVNRMLQVIAAQSRDLEYIKRMYDETVKKYPDSWWASRLEQTFYNTSLTEGYDLLSMILRQKIIKSLYEMENDGTKIIKRMSKPSVIFEELRDMVMDWEFGDE